MQDDSLPRRIAAVLRALGKPKLKTFRGKVYRRLDQMTEDFIDQPLAEEAEDSPRSAELFDTGLSLLQLECLEGEAPLSRTAHQDVEALRTWSLLP